MGGGPRAAVGGVKEWPGSEGARVIGEKKEEVWKRTVNGRRLVGVKGRARQGEGGIGVGKKGLTSKRNFMDEVGRPERQSRGRGTTKDGGGPKVTKKKTETRVEGGG